MLAFLIRIKIVYVDSVNALLLDVQAAYLLWTITRRNTNVTTWYQDRLHIKFFFGW